ncbi:transposase-like protein (plasmid) [Borreliella burgdorferi 94a]|nr:transposase-like protein [Borreliella burgdorferi 94a]
MIFCLIYNKNTVVEKVAYNKYCILVAGQHLDIDNRELIN